MENLIKDIENQLTHLLQSKGYLGEGYRLTICNEPTPDTTHLYINWDDLEGYFGNESFEALVFEDYHIHDIEISGKTIPVFLD